jgi:protocatechuate 4,5-dioxygenase beta chain/2,3-dihydroxyphenylpropionate 1,2-dioxygenase
MGSIIGGMLTSHAYAFVEPETWDTRRAERTRPNYAKKYGSVPPERPEVATETLAGNKARYESIRAGFAEIRSRLATLNADTIVLVGNDQDENFTPQAYPQFAVYTGADFAIKSRTSGAGAMSGAPVHYRAAPKVARTILETALESGFDPAAIERFSDDALESHAHREPLSFYDPDATQTVVPVFVNAIHEPAPSPARCYAFGKMLRDAIERSPEAGRTIVFASGGLSHFPADYPWREYDGPLTVGAISEPFDRTIVERMRAGDGAALAQLTSADLMANGEGELRQAIVMLGAVGDVSPAFLAYEPFYRAVMGFAVGVWDLEESTSE